jgi:Tfp pilus assembly protein PilX
MPLRNLQGEQGMILIVVLLLLSLLMAIGIGAVVSVRNDLRTTGNLRSATAAAYLADAGIEWSKQQIAATATMPPVLSDTTQGLSAGSYAVSFLSSNLTDPLSVRVVLRSVGSANTAIQSVHAQISKSYDLSDGALALRGRARSIIFAATSFSISGLDHDLVTGTPLSGSRPRAGISVAATAVLNQLAGALDPVRTKNISGDDGSGAVIGTSDRISGNDAARLADDLCAAVNSVVLMVPSAGSLSVAAQTWGNRAAPEVHCVNGLSSSGDSVVFGANTGGAGILVVRDAELVLAGDFNWDGWIIVSGSDVGLRVMGAAHKQILGAVLIHDSGNATASGPAMLDLQGLLAVRFSRQALNLAASLVPRTTLEAVYAALPFVIKQDYWRSITP